MPFETVYLLTNKAMPGMVKIGMTSSHDVGKRLAQLHTTGVPLPFDLEFACQVPNGKVVENALHTAFAPNRVNANREFFSIKPEQAIAIMKLLHVQEVTQEVGSEMAAATAVEDLAASAAFTKVRRPPLDFLAMGIPLNSTLIFTASGETANVVAPKKVSYNGEVMSLTMATRKVKGLPLDYPIQPTPFWSYDGVGLSALYENAFGEEFDADQAVEPSQS